MWYTIKKTEPFELDLKPSEAAALEGSEAAAFLHHKDGNLYYFEHDDDGAWDDEAVGRFMRKAKKKGVLKVLVMDDDGSQDCWVFDYGPGVFAMRDE